MYHLDLSVYSGSLETFEKEHMHYYHLNFSDVESVLSFIDLFNVDEIVDAKCITDITGKVSTVDLGLNLTSILKL